MLLQTRNFSAPCHFTPKTTTKISTNPSNSISFRSTKCSISTQLELKTDNKITKPFPAEVSRTIMDLATAGTFSTLTQQGCPIGIGVRFAVDSDNGNPFFYFNHNSIPTAYHKIHDTPSSLHVKFLQSGLRTPQCTLQGTLTKPQDPVLIKRLVSLWKKRFGEEVDQDFIHIIDVDRVLHLDDFQEDGVWFTSLDYKNAQPDPLREFAENLVAEINTNNMEDITRFCNVYVDLDFQVSEAKMIWVDRLGLDMRLFSPNNGLFEVRIPFPREVTDEKGAKSTFNCMSQLAWEVERNFHPLDFEKVTQLKHIKS
ncbi:hypothetical protein RYX36_011285 [Vicia faba]